MTVDLQSHRPRDPTVTKVLFVLLLLSSLLGYVKIPNLHFSFFNLSHPLFAFGLLLLHLGRVRETLRRQHSTLIALVLFYVWTWVSAFSSDFPGIAIRYSLKYSLHIAAFLALLTITARSQGNDAFYRLTYRFLTVLALFGLVEYLAPHLQVFTLLRSPDSLTVYPRISSLMQGPNQYSALLSIGILLGFLSYRNHWIGRLEFGVSTLLLLSASALAKSDNGWLILCIGIFLALLYRLIAITSAAFVLPALVLAGLLLNLSTHSLPLTHTKPVLEATSRLAAASILQGSKEKIRFRLSVWRTAINQIEKRPVTGMGIQVFGKRIGGPVFGSEHYHAHNLLLNLGAEIGLPGVLLFLILLYIVFKHADLSSPLSTIPLLMILSSQVLDYYMHDLTYTTFSLFFVAAAINSKNDPS